ncbi:hypothetical protein [Lysobacter sp. HA35]
MTAFDYARTAATATRLLQRFGAAATLKRRADATYDPTTGTTAATVTPLATTAVVIDYDAKSIDGTLIRQGDRRGYLIAAVAPRQDDALTWQGADLTVIAVRILAPAGVAVLYEAQLRG